jgi:hypothetical protein
MKAQAHTEPTQANGNGHPKTLAELIAAKKQEVADLELLSNAEFELGGTMDKVRGAVTAVLHGNPYDGTVVDLVRKLVNGSPVKPPTPNAVEGKTLGTILEEHLKAIKLNISANDLLAHALSVGWQTKSSNPIGVVQQCLKTDKRFSSVKTGFGNHVHYGLAQHKRGPYKKGKRKAAKAAHQPA